MKIHTSLRKFMEKFIEFGKFRWIVSSDNSFGFLLYGFTFIYYKWPDTPLIYFGNKGKMNWRTAEKRELNNKDLKY